MSIPIKAPKSRATKVCYVIILLTWRALAFTRYRQVSQGIWVNHKRILPSFESPVCFLAFVLSEFILCHLYPQMELFLNLHQKTLPVFSLPFWLYYQECQFVNRNSLRCKLLNTYTNTPSPLLVLYPGLCSYFSSFAPFFILFLWRIYSDTMEPGLQD